MLEKIKILLGLSSDDSKDELLQIMLGLAKEEATDYCNLTEYNSKLDSAVIGMVIEKFNKLGTEGLSSVSTNGIREEYFSGYSKSVITKLNKNRKVRCV